MCYFCVQDVEKLLFCICLKQVSMLCHICLFLSCVLGVFNRQVVTLVDRALRFSPSLCKVFDYVFYLTQAVHFVYSCHDPRSSPTTLCC